MFLAYVRGRDALQIGSTLLVTGAAQLAMSPIAVALEQRLDARWLTAAGFIVFGIGLALSAFQTRDTDFDQMLIPQVIRGVAIMFCLLPPTRLALGSLPETQVPAASGLFNLMRNLGGAVGIALIDTILYGRGRVHADALKMRLMAGDTKAAEAIGLDPSLLARTLSGPSLHAMEPLVRPMIERTAFVWSANEAWAMLAATALFAVLLVPFAWRAPIRGTETIPTPDRTASVEEMSIQSPR